MFIIIRSDSMQEDLQKQLENMMQSSRSKGSKQKSKTLLESNSQLVTNDKNNKKLKVGHNSSESNNSSLSNNSNSNSNRTSNSSVPASVIPMSISNNSTARSVTHNILHSSAEPSSYQQFVDRGETLRKVSYIIIK